jgi:hypothetical protein
MNVSQTATKGHLIVGAGLVAAALGCLIASFFFSTQWFPGLIFFFGIWGGVELGRYLEHSLNPAPEESEA